MGTKFGIKFWGTRGLVASPSIERAMFGGNTTCIQIMHENQLILVDTGFGITNLGEELLEKIIKEKKSFEIDIFYTHFHWDHIQGLPFFNPIYFPHTSLRLHYPGDSNTIFKNLDILFDGSYSPFSGISNMPSKISFHELTNKLQLHGLTIEYCPVDHGDDDDPGEVDATFAYKFTNQRGDIACIITDHEARPSHKNHRLIEFSKDCDLLIHDGQYTSDEYAVKVGWGHSSIEHALDNAKNINCNQTLLTHHYPSRTDAEIQVIQRNLQKQSIFKDIKFSFARENIFYPVVPEIKRTTKKTKKAG